MTQQQKPSPAELYQQYFVPAIFNPCSRVLLEYADPQPGERVLDLACATGTVARKAASLVGPEGEVVGLDISPDMLAVARALPEPAGATIEWREGDAVDLDQPDDAFDLALCQQGFQFFADRSAAAREMQRVLRRGGRAVVSIWQPLNRHPVYKVLLEAEARYLDAPLSDVAAPFTFSDADALHTLLRDAGFEQIEIIPKSFDVEFPDPDRFVALTVLAGAAVVPEFAQEDPAAREALIEAVAREGEAVVQRHSNGDTVQFPMPAYVAVAYAA